MQKIYQLVSTDIKTNKLSTDTNCYDNDLLFKQLSDLVNPEFKAWYCREFYRLGRDKVLQLASIARADAKTNPRGYFSKLVKNG